MHLDINAGCTRARSHTLVACALDSRGACVLSEAAPERASERVRVRVRGVGVGSRVSVTGIPDDPECV